MMNELKPCALCGNTLMDTSNDDGLFPAGRNPADGWLARCGNPDCSMEVFGDTKADAARRWNRRPEQRLANGSLDAAYGLGFVAACHWPEPVPQDVQSAAFKAERDALLKTLKGETCPH